MSEEEFEVRGPHEEALEGGESEGDSFSSRIAVATAILATVGAFFSYQASSTQNEAAMFKNDAAIKKTEAANQWNFYQAKSNGYVQNKVERLSFHVLSNNFYRVVFGWN